MREKIGRATVQPFKINRSVKKKNGGLYEGVYALSSFRTAISCSLGGGSCFTLPLSTGVSVSQSKQVGDMENSLPIYLLSPSPLF